MDDMERLKDMLKHIEPEEKRAETARRKSLEGKENLRYIIEKQAGSCETQFHNGWKLDCKEDGAPSEDGRYGQHLPYFANLRDAKKAQLNEGHVLALRLYSTSSYWFINQPLRDTEHANNSIKLKQPHPLLLTVVVMQDAIEKLRKVAAGRYLNESKEYAESTNSSSASGNPSSSISLPKFPNESTNQSFSLSLPDPTASGSAATTAHVKVGDSPRLGATEGGAGLAGEFGTYDMREEEEDGSAGIIASIASSLRTWRERSNKKVSVRLEKKSMRGKLIGNDGSIFLRMRTLQLTGRGSQIGSPSEVEEKEKVQVKKRNIVFYYWRGLHGLKPSNAFREHGGCEPGAMSTTEKLEVALRYALGDKVGTDEVPSTAFLLRFVVRKFVHDGADISFCSTFPHEKELLYPPLTLMTPQRDYETVVYGSTVFSIIDVEPHYPGK